MPGFEEEGFRERQVTEMDRKGRVVKSEGRLARPSLQPPTNSALAQAIHAHLDAQQNGSWEGGSVSVSIGRVTVARKVYPAAKHAGRLARELAGLK
jgi:hypothetical protein